MRSLALALGLATAFVLAGCASSGSVDPNTPETCVTVDNSGGGSAAGRVYLMGENRERIRIGEVPMGRAVEHCIRRSAFSGRYWLVIEEGQADRMDPAMRQNQPNAFRSDTFALNPGDRITWDIRTNRILLGAGGAG